MKIKLKKSITFGYIKIKPTINNIFITLTDLNGNVIISKHAGSLAFKGRKKATPYIASVVFANLIEDILEDTIVSVEACILQILGSIKYTKIKGMLKKLDKNQFDMIDYDDIIVLQYINKKAHNGVRRAKQRRI
jgi:small subunit ribosomal protein S11